MRVLGLIALALLAGCSPERPVQPPKIVEVVVEKLVPVPAPLTVDCASHEPQAQTVEEAVRLANVRKAATDECTGRMRQIRALNPQPNEVTP